MAHSEKKHFEVLDGLRGIAALAVVVFHYMEYIESDYSKSFIGHGFLAVDFFFCLSGFVIAYAYDGRMEKLGLREFFRSRIIRLHPLVVFGSVLGLIGYLFIPFGGLAQPGLFSMAELFVCSVLLIPCPIMAASYFNLFSFNAPAWSLFWEYVANLFYGLVLSHISRLVLAILLLPAAAAICFVIFKDGSLLGGWSGPTFWDGLARVAWSFLAGMAIFRFGWTINSRMSFWLVALMLLLALMFPFSKKNIISESVIVLLYFPLLIAFGAGSTPSSWVQKFCVFSGKISYPLYMTHYWLIWIFGDYYGRHRPVGSRLFWIVAAGVVIQVVLAYAVMRLYDIPVRRRLSKASPRV